MPYSTEELKQAQGKRKKLQDLIDWRQKQERIWVEQKEKIFVPADINFSDISGQTLLDYAVMIGEIETVKSLVEQGAKSKLALQHALVGGYPQIAKYLIDNQFRCDPIIAIIGTDPACHDVIAKYDLGASPIAHAIATKNLLLLESLIKNGVDIKQVVYAPWQYSPMQLALRNGFLDGVKLLKAKGASLNEIDFMGASALHIAIRSGDPETVKYVLENAKDLPMHASYHINPIHTLALAKHNNKEITRIVLAHPTLKSLINEKDYFGHTPLDIARINHKHELFSQLGISEQDIPLLEKYDIRQEKILNNLTYFLKATNLGDPASVPGGGHCQGFAFLFSYYSDRGLKDEFFKILKLISNWDGNLGFLRLLGPVQSFSGNYKNVADLFQQWVNDIIWFQQTKLDPELRKFNPTPLIKKAPYDMVKKDDKSFALEPRMILNLAELSYPLNKDQLNEYLNILSNLPGLNITLASGRFKKGEEKGHATSLRVLQPNVLDYYDSNEPNIVDLFTSQQALVTHIVDTTYRNNHMLGENETMESIILYDPSGLTPKETMVNITDKKSYINYYQASPNKLTPLHVAVLVNDEKCLKRLLELDGVDRSLRNLHGQTAWEMAIEFQADNLLQLFASKDVGLRFRGPGQVRSLSPGEGEARTQSKPKPKPKPKAKP